MVTESADAYDAFRAGYLSQARPSTSARVVRDVCWRPVSAKR